MTVIDKLTHLKNSYVFYRKMHRNEYAELVRMDMRIILANRTKIL